MTRGMGMIGERAIEREREREWVAVSMGENDERVGAVERGRIFWGNIFHQAWL
jgi:hypothetical protein